MFTTRANLRPQGHEQLQGAAIRDGFACGSN